jgi:hypothetical protein
MPSRSRQMRKPATHEPIAPLPSPRLVDLTVD